MHVPLHSSGYHGDDPTVRPLQQLLYTYGADVVVSGHEHAYERLAPARPGGKVDYKHGLRQFIVGTGGAELRGPGPEAAPHSRVFESSTWGVLKLTLRKNSCDWKFLPISGQEFTDSGTGYCHGKP